MASQLTLPRNSRPYDQGLLTVVSLDKVVNPYFWWGYVREGRLTNHNIIASSLCKPFGTACTPPWKTLWKQSSNTVYVCTAVHFNIISYLKWVDMGHVELSPMDPMMIMIQKILPDSPESSSRQWNLLGGSSLGGHQPWWSVSSP